MKILLKDPSPVSVSTNGELIINGKCTKIILPTWIKKLVLGFLDWRFDKRHKHRAGTICNQNCI